MSLERPSGRRRDEIVERRPSEADGREGFIRKYGLLPFISALALNAAVTYKEQPAQAAEVQPGMTWPQGFSALRADVFKSPVEQSAHAVVTKDGKVYWAGSKMGERTGVVGNSSDDLRSVHDEISDKSLEVFCMFHTHPVLTGEHAKLIDKSEADAAIVSGNTTLSIPPSGDDVNYSQSGSKIVTSKIEDGGGYVVKVVFDPSGVWRHRMATDSDFQKSPDYWKEILGERELVVQWEQHIKAILEDYSEKQLNALRSLLPENEQDAIAFMERHRWGTGYPTGYTAEAILEAKRSAIFYTALNPKTTSLRLMAEIYRGNDTGLRLQDQLDAITGRKQRYAETWNDVVYNQYIPASRQGEPGAELHKKLTEAYLRIGTVLESFTYDEVADDPLKLCRWPGKGVRYL